MNGAPPTAHEKLEQVDLIVRAVDQRGREMERKWGTGRLPLIVPLEMAERFRVQRRKFSAAVWEYDPQEARKHGDAMLRAYAAMDAAATACGAPMAPVSQWEFEGPQGTVILVRGLDEVAQVDTGGRQVEVWSLDEVASVLRNYPTLAAAKQHFPGAIVETIRPAADIARLDDELADLPW